MFTDPKVKSKKIPKGHFTIDPPQLGSFKQMSMFGILSIMTVLAFNVPIVIDNITASAEGFPLEDEIRNAEHTNVRIHFSSDFGYENNLRDIDAALLEELCSLKNNLADKNSNDTDDEELSEGFGGRRES